MKREIVEPNEVSIETLVEDVYESAAPAERTRLVSLLVGKVYADSPPAEKSNLVEQLMRPLGILSLLAVANGIFANIRLHGDWTNMQARVAYLQKIDVSDVVALANFAQESSIQAVDGISGMLSTSGTLAGSAAALILIRILSERARRRRESDNLNI
jgi:hypothetical protein